MAKEYRGGEELLSSVIKWFSGCALDEGRLRGIVDGVLGLDEGRIVVAELVGDVLKVSGCGVGVVEDLLGRAGGSAVAFAVNYVSWKLGVFKDGGWDPKRIRAFSRLLPIRHLLVNSDIDVLGDYIMPSGLVQRLLEWEGVYGDVEYPQVEELKRTIPHWLAQKHHSLIERALGLITLASTLPFLGQELETTIKSIPPLNKALQPWIQYGEKLPMDEAEKLLKPQPEHAVEYFLERYGDKLMQEFKPECWRRLALMAGAVLYKYSFSLIIDIDNVRHSLRKGLDLFEGLLEATKPCDIDDLLLEDNDITLVPPFSEILLRLGNSVYRAYVNNWVDIIEELKRLRNKWVSRGGYLTEEAIYALGLAILLANAKAMGKEVDSKDAEAALWSSRLGIRYVPPSSIMDDAIRLLSPLRDVNRSGWAHLISGAAQIMVTDGVRKELDTIYDYARNLEEWVKAELAETYAEVGDGDKACSLLNELRDDALRFIIGARVYHNLAVVMGNCSNVHACDEFEKLSQNLRELAREASANPREFLNRHPELRKYLKQYSLNPEEWLVEVVKEAQILTLLGLGYCALSRGRLKDAMNYYGDAVNTSRELGEWLYNQYVKSSPTDLMNAEDLSEVKSIFEMYWTARQLFGLSKELSVITRLILKYLGAKVKMPSSKEILDAVEPGVSSDLLPALAKILGVQVEDDKLCSCAHLAVRNDREAKELVKQHVMNRLSGANEADVLRSLLEMASVRQLIEVYAPETSMVRFILLLRALTSGDRDLAILHAEVGRVSADEPLTKELFGELANALRNNNKNGIREALTKLYHYHFQTRLRTRVRDVLNSS